MLNAAAKETRTASEWAALKQHNSLIAYSDLEDSSGDDDPAKVKVPTNVEVVPIKAEAPKDAAEQ